MSLGAAAMGAAMWAIPLIVASGGLAGYLRALGSQAGEDFSGVVMLWTTRTPRVAVLALLQHVRPALGLAGARRCHAGARGGGVLFLLGLGRTGSRASLIPIATRSDSNGFRALVLLAIMFAPYALFHLVFQETLTVRYALPLVLPLTYLAATRDSRCPAGAGPHRASASLVVTMLSTGGAGIRRICEDTQPDLRRVCRHGGDDQIVAPTRSAMHRRVWTESQAGAALDRAAVRHGCCRRRAITNGSSCRARGARVTRGRPGSSPTRAAPISRCSIRRAARTVPYRWPFDGPPMSAARAPTKSIW